MTNALWALKGEIVWFHGWVTRVSGSTGIGQKRNFTGKLKAILTWPWSQVRWPWTFASAFSFWSWSLQCVRRWWGENWLQVVWRAENCDSQLEKHEEALVDEERWRSLHQVTSCVPVQKEKKNLCRTEALPPGLRISEYSEFWVF